jgi:thiosulfate/3-mercaptopyruvate sulfurtransferase
MKIGLNYDREAPGAGYEYMLVRHEPTDRDLFASYVKDALTNFDSTPNWKRTSPHNIQRKTWQSATCNNCHGNRDLFLSEGDLLDYEVKANSSVVVPDSKVPGKIKDSPSLVLDTTKVRRGMVVSSQWLHDNLGRKGLVVLDPRSKEDYSRGHIEGAIRFDPLRSGIRSPAKGPKPNVLIPPDKIASRLGRAGISADDHIVVYGQNGHTAGFLLWVLEYVGAGDVSYLDGGIEGWEEAGFHLTQEVATRKPKKFNAAPRRDFMADGDYIREHLGQPGVKVVDVRLITQAKGMVKHDLAAYAGAVPESVNLPLGAFYMDNGFLKSPEELLWTLEKSGLAPDRKVITTCNTGIQAGAAFFVLRYLGFEDVRVHDESWITWSLM